MSGGTLSLGSESTGSFGRLEQSDEIVASPSTFNLADNRTGALEEDEFGNLQFVDSSFTSSKFLIDTEFDFGRK